MLIHSQNKILNTTLSVFILLATFIASWSVVRAESIIQQPSLITRMSQSLGSNLANTNQSSQFVKVPVFPLGYVYPIEQLGNCNNAEQCFTFCERPQNIAVCATVSRQQGFMSDTQTRKAIAFANLITEGYLSGCGGMSECVKLCDNVNVQNDCQQLAINIESSASVLGATDGQDNFLGRSIFETCDNLDNCSTIADNSRVGSAYTNLANSGQLPYGCTNGQQCFQYCLSNSQVAGCSNFMAMVGGVDTSSLNLFKTSNLNPNGGLSYQDLLEQGGGGSGGGQGLPTPQLDVIDIQSCLYKNQVGLNEDSITPDQFNTYNQNNKECQDQYTPNVDANRISEAGRTKAIDGIGSISDCILGARNSSQDFSRCFSLR